MEIRYFKHWSSHLNRDMEFKVYGSGSGKPVLFIPCQGGRFWDFESFHMIDTWAKWIEAGECRKGLLECSALIALRKAYPEARRGRILWRDLGERRLICYDRMLDGGSRVLRVVMNAEQKDCSIPVDGQLLYSRNLSGNTLAPGGIAIMVLNN